MTQQARKRSTNTSTTDQTHKSSKHHHRKRQHGGGRSNTGGGGRRSNNKSETSQRLIMCGMLLFILANIFMGHRIMSVYDSYNQDNNEDLVNNLHWILSSAELWSVQQSNNNNNSSNNSSNNNSDIRSGEPFKQKLNDDQDGHPVAQERQNEVTIQQQTNANMLRHNLAAPLKDHEAFSIGDDGGGRNVTCPPSYLSHYKGILHIAMGDIGGGASTIFFQFVIGQLIYAEQYHLLPLIHLNNVSYIIYDPVVHENGGEVGPRGINVTFHGSRPGTVPDIVRPDGHWRDRIPGKPIFDPTDHSNNNNGAPAATTTIHLKGSGVWQDYFLPVVPSLDVTTAENRAILQSCAQSLPYVTLSLKQITPGIHGFASWAPKCWRYHYLPDYVTKPHWPLHEWLRPSRLLGHAAVQRYQIQFQPYIVQKAQLANPHCWTNDHDNAAAAGGSDADANRHKCLGLHIRHSDKAAGRRQVPVAEFWPFVQAFVHAGGEYIYLATDSTLVLREIEQSWPADIVRRISHLGGAMVAGGQANHHHGDHDDQGGDAASTNTDQAVVRSSNDQAVFDIAASNHHVTNVQALVEIQALSFCTFLVHGLSALSESALWLNQDLHRTSVNLEDPDHIKPASFGTLIQMVLRGDNHQNGDNNHQAQLPKPTPSSKWWKVRPPQMGGVGGRQEKQSAETASSEQLSLASLSCASGYHGVLLISSVGGNKITTDVAFFTHVLNQLLYAEKHNLLPWIHIIPDEEKSVLFDAWAHYGGHHNTNKNGSNAVHFKTQWNIPLMENGGYPGPPSNDSIGMDYNQDGGGAIPIKGNGIWESYFNPVPSFNLQEDNACRNLPVATLSDAAVVALTTQAPWSVRAWKYKHVPDHLWKPNNSGMTWKDWYAPIRKQANSVVSKYYHFNSYLTERANVVNPVKNGEVCVAVHMVTANDYLDYLTEFVSAGGNFIYISTNSWRVLKYVSKNFPGAISSKVRTQGDHFVRTTKEWPLHMIDNHHRVNGETFVDILAMSKCQFLLHSSTTASEAAIYLNLNLQNNSVNVHDPDKISAAEFGLMVKRVVDESRSDSEPLREQVVNSTHPKPDDTFAEYKLDSATIVSRESSRGCRRNAVVYLAQKKHSSYTGKDSYSSLLRSLDLVNKNYLSLNNHLDNLDIFIFHTNDFTTEDFNVFESRLGPSFHGVIRLVNLTGSPFWRRPNHHIDDDPNSWYAYPLFSEGYRRMMHWFAIDIWKFFGQMNEERKCSYRYIFRLDEDSFLHSPIEYDIFDFMRSHQYVYGFRLCAYEMQVTRRMWNLYKTRNPEFQPTRDVVLEMCGFYNNFFIADLEFFLSAPVQKFLRFIDRQGHIYRRRLGDLMIHSMAVYGHADPDHIHRFLDFTYEHGTRNQSDDCLVWGGIQAGYNDANATATLNQFYETNLLERGCKANATLMQPRDLSPTYAHLTREQQDSLSLYTITAGRVEFPLNKRILSG